MKDFFQDKINSVHFVDAAQKYVNIKDYHNSYNIYKRDRIIILERKINKLRK